MRPPSSRAGLLLAIPIGGALLLLRQGETPAWTTLWAEDGRFVAEAVAAGPLATLLEPYAGYGPIIARLIAGLAAALPIEMAAAVVAITSALITAAVAAFVFVAAEAMVDDRRVRAALAAMTILLPSLGYEVMNNAANLQFVLIWGAWWALLWRPTTTAGRAAAAVVAASAALSGAAALILTPLLAVRLALTRRPADHLVSVAWLAGAVIQLAVVLSTSTIPPERSPSAAAAVVFYLVRVVAEGFLGPQVSDALWTAFGGSAVVVLSGAALLLLVLALFRREPFEGRGWAAIAVLSSIGLFFVAAALRWDQLGEPGPGQTGVASSRLTVVPALLLVAAVAALVGRPDPRLRPSVQRIVSVAVVATLAFAVAVGYRVTANGREAGPEWPAALEAARPTCTTGVATVEVPITPPGWYATLPCDQLVEDGDP